MQYRFFRIPVNDNDQAAEEMNRFLRSAKVLAAHRQFVEQGESSFWAMAVEYLPVEGRQDPGEKRGKVDYRETLAPDAFAVFVRLRQWRKDAAAREAVPVYTIFTNEQLAAMARRGVRSVAELREIEGVGDARVSKYGDEIFSVLAASREPDEESGKPVSEDR